MLVTENTVTKFVKNTVHQSRRRRGITHGLSRQVIQVRFPPDAKRVYLGARIVMQKRIIIRYHQWGLSRVQFNLPNRFTQNSF